MPPVEPLSPTSLLVKRPHFRLVDRDLYFLISTRPTTTLTEGERDVWLALDREPRVEALRARFGTAVDATLTRFVELELCEVAESSWPANRRRVVVFEPHSDDAALSVGATMWQRRHDTEFIVVTLGGRSNFTSYYYLFREYFDPEHVSALRAAEGRLFMRLLGGQYVALQQNEAPLRYRDGNWTLDWLKKHRVSISAFDNHRSSDAELAAWKRAVRRILETYDADEVWLPLGVGTHTDHELTRDAVLDALIEDPTLAERSEIRLFQDVPYDANFPAHAETILASLRSRGARLERESVSIGRAALAAKLRLVSVYASQFKLGTIAGDIERSATLAAGGMGLAESFYRLARRPSSRDSYESYLDRDAVGREEHRFVRWAERARTAKALRILLLMPAGRYREDVELLLRVFPSAAMEVYVTEVSAPEVADFEHERVRVREVARGGRAWALLALELATKRPAPTMFLAGNNLERAKVLSRLWPLADAIVLPTLDHFMRGFTNALDRLGVPYRAQPLDVLDDAAMELREVPAWSGVIEVPAEIAAAQKASS